MSKETVSIERAKTAPSCELWDGRMVKPGACIVVAVSAAADLLSRDPSDWTVAEVADLGLVNAEIKRRAAVADAPEPDDSGGGN